MRATPLRQLSAFLVPTLALAALATVAGLLWLPSADQARAQTAQTVPSDWPLIPEGFEPGDRFRLLFVTSTTTNASSANIADYNAHAQAAANGNASVQSFKGEFAALISTSAVDARDNTGTTGTGVPIHWLGGEKVADDYADLYDKDWDSVSGKTEGGGSYTGLVWTGGNKAGQKSGQKYAGADEVRLGDLSDAGSALSSPNAKVSSEAYPLYALSPVITVAEPEPEPTPTPTPTPTPQPDNNEPATTAGPAIASSPQSGDTYGAGETVKISYTFSEAVTVAGGPKSRLVAGERKRWTHYSHAENDGTTLVFTYAVKEEDRDANGISIPKNAIRLSGGTIQDADGNAANLKHPALSDQAGHKVDGSQEEAPAGGQSGEQQQQSSNSQPAFAADTATRSVNENSAAGTNIGSPVVATDADGDTLAYALSGNYAGSFDIGLNTGQLKVKDALNYEKRKRYTLTVSVSDGKADDGSADSAVDDTIAVTISIGNVDEAGTVSFDANPPRVGSALTAALKDPDRGVTGATWAWERSADGNQWSDIESANAAAYTPADDDAGKYLRAAVSYADGQGPNKTASAATVSPVAESTKAEGAPDSNETQFASVSAGWYLTCGAKKDDGSVICWGSDNGGKGTPPTGSFASVSAGWYHTCGVKTGGAVACWGSDHQGQSTPPTGSFASVSAGGSHTCGVRADGAVACWGFPSYGQATPPTGSFASVSAGGVHTCGVKTDGAVACWGYGGNGRTTPPAGSFRSVSAGYAHTCGVKKGDGAVACWGYDNHGQARPPTGSFTSVSAGWYHTCGVKTDGVVACWGSDDYDRATPPTGSFASVSAGWGHTCGLKTDGSAACWGDVRR